MDDLRWSLGVWPARVVSATSVSRKCTVTCLLVIGYVGVLGTSFMDKENWKNTFSTAKVLHRDLRSSKILLDHQWNSKVSDLGLAKLLCSEHSYVTTRVMGTFGKNVKQRTQC